MLPPSPPTLPGLTWSCDTPKIPLWVYLETPQTPGVDLFAPEVYLSRDVDGVGGTGRGQDVPPPLRIAVPRPCATFITCPGKS